MERLKAWRFCGTFGGIRNSAASSLAALSKLVDTEDFTTGDGVKATKRWGEERDSWSNKGYAPYFGAQWIGVLPGPGVDDLPEMSIGIDNDAHTAGHEL